jgi:hypothetical protein
MGRDRRTSERGDEPRWISQHLTGEPTPRASEIVEPTPDTNLGGGGAIRVGSTRPSPGAEAVVAEPAEIAGHTDDDSRVRIETRSGGEVEAYLDDREPVEPLARGGAEPVEGAPAGSPPAPLEGVPEVEPVDNGPGSEGSLDGQRLEVDPSSPVPGEVVEFDGEPGQGTAVATATAGTPGTYTPELVGDDRPGTLLELGDRVTPDPDGPWPEGTWVPYGSGKRAHYGPDGWHTGESPGYGTAGA